MQLFERDETRSGARFSECRRFRYLLWRSWGDGPLVHFCMLNPSIADENDLDPTLRRCKGFAERWGMGGMLITNLFPLVATDPKELIRTRDRSGPQIGPSCFGYLNDNYLYNAGKNAALTVVGWGSNMDRKELQTQLPRVYHAILKHFEPKCLRQTRTGQPVHPLYLPYDAELSDWRLA